MARVHPGDVRVSTGISCNPKHWVGGELYVSTKEKRVNYIRTRLKEIDSLLFAECSKKQDKGENFTAAEIAQILHPHRQKGRQPDATIREYYLTWRAEYLSHKNRGNPEGSKGLSYTKNQKQVLVWLERFKPNLKLKDIDKTFFNQYLDFIYAASDLQDGAINNQIKFLRTILAYAGMNNNFIQTIPQEPNETFDLYWSEVLALKNARYSSLELEQTAHAFVINCQLPFRWVDFSTLKPENYISVLSDRFGPITVINATQNKTMAGVYIPIPPLARELINRHGRIPIPLQKKGRQDYNRFYKNLKRVAVEAGLDRMVQQSETRNQQRTYSLEPIYHVLSPHNARHTAASRIYAATKNEALKERLLGHKKKSDPYTNHPPLEIAEDLLAAWELIDKT